MAEQNMMLAQNRTKFFCDAAAQKYMTINIGRKQNKKSGELKSMAPCPIKINGVYRIYGAIN
jgi:hypothetical protein